MPNQPYPGQIVPPINVPISASNYIQQMPPPQKILVKEPLPQRTNYQSEYLDINIAATR